MPRSPQDKKRLSYERDGSNAYGENDKASRKAIPRFKAASNRGLRRKTRTLLAADRIEDSDVSETVDVDLAKATFKGLHPTKRKEPDTPLGLLIGNRAEDARGARVTPATARRRAAILRQIVISRTFGRKVYDQGGRRNTE